MRIIHTSDWHIGQSFYNYSRDDEHRHFAKQLANEIYRLKPDTLIVAGDIFDVAVPSIQAQRLLVEILTMLHDACPSMKIVLIAGNHDRASRLDITPHFGITSTLILLPESTTTNRLKLILLK